MSSSAGTFGIRVGFRRNDGASPKRPTGETRPPAVWQIRRACHVSSQAGAPSETPAVVRYKAPMVDNAAPTSYLVHHATGPGRGRATLPGSKSYTNRALVLAALARGKSVLEGALFSDDTVHMANGLGALGFSVTRDEKAARFEVAGRAGQLPAEQASIFVGNSGTTARFLTALMALGHGVYDLDG